MDFQSASTELTGADKTGAFGPDVELGNAESLESSLKADKESCEREPARLGQGWLGKRLGNSVNKPSVKIGLVARIPFYLIASLLSATAMAKVWMLLADPFADIRAGIPKEILWGTVVFELWLAIENLRIRDHRVLASIDVFIFSAFAIFSGVRWAMGYGSCGCAGNFEVPPWFFLLIDIGIVLGFLSSAVRRSVVFDGWRELANWWNGWSTAAKGQLVGLLLFVGFLGFLQLPIAAPLRASVLGESPIQAIVRVDGDLVLGKESIGQVEIWNHSSQSAKVIGMERSCRCIKLSGDPTAQVIAARGKDSLPLIILPNKAGPLHQRFVLFLDHPIQFRMNIDVVGSVKGVK